MKFLVLLACVAVCYSAKLPHHSQHGGSVHRQVHTSSIHSTSPVEHGSELVRSNYHQNEDASQFSYNFETVDNIIQEVEGQVRQIGDKYGVIMSGTYSFISPEGINVEIRWTADENGFSADGEHVPKNPAGYGQV